MSLIDRNSLRLCAALLLAGQMLFIVVTLFHADGPANNHPVVFAEYAASGSWKVVHLAQFFSMAILVAGLFGLHFALDVRAGAARWASRFGAAAAVMTLSLYGVLQAVDGIANKQAVDAWVSAPAAERAARFASAEAIRWIEWGVRSYQNLVLGLALILIAAAVVRTAAIPRPLGYLMGLAGITYLVQGWVVGAEGFSGAETIAIEVAYVLDVAWMIWLVVIAWRMEDLGSSVRRG